MTNRRCGWGLALVGSLNFTAACGGRISDGGELTGSAGGSAATAGNGSSTSGGATGGIAGSGGTGAGRDAGFCHATCATPTDSRDVPGGFDQVHQLLAGQWTVCSGARDVFVGAPADVAGIEFVPPQGAPGKVFYLVEGTHGLERNPGVAYQLTYEIGSSSDSGWYVFIHPANSGFMTYPRFTVCPRQIVLSAKVSGEGARLVPYP